MIIDIVALVVIFRLTNKLIPDGFKLAHDERGDDSVIFLESLPDILQKTDKISAIKSALHCSTLSTKSITLENLRTKHLDNVLTVNEVGMLGTETVLKLHGSFKQNELVAFHDENTLRGSGYALSEGDGVLRIIRKGPELHKWERINLVKSEGFTQKGDVAIFSSDNTLVSSGIKLNCHRSNGHLKISRNHTIECVKLFKRPTGIEQNRALFIKNEVSPEWEFAASNNDMLTWSEGKICFRNNLTDHLKDHQIVGVRSKQLRSLFSFDDNETKRRILYLKDKETISSRRAPTRGSNTKENELLRVQGDSFSSFGLRCCDNTSPTFRVGDKLGLVDVDQLGSISTISEMIIKPGKNILVLDGNNSMTTVFEYDDDDRLNLNKLQLGNVKVSRGFKPVKLWLLSTPVTKNVTLTPLWKTIVSLTFPIQTVDNILSIVANCYTQWTIKNSFDKQSMVVVYKLVVFENKPRLEKEAIGQIASPASPNITTSCSMLMTRYKFDRHKDYVIELRARSETRNVVNDITANCHSSIKLLV